MATPHGLQGGETSGADSEQADFGSAPGQPGEVERGSFIDPNGNMRRRVRTRGRKGSGGASVSSVGVGSSVCWLLTGVTVGAGLMYLLDPERGRRRRALLRDKCVSLSSQTGDALGRTARHLGNRAQGVAAEASKALGRPWPHRREQADEGQSATLREATQM